MQLSGTLSNYARNMPDLQIMPEFFSGVIRFAHYARFVISGIQLCHLAALFFSGDDFMLTHFAYRYIL